MFPIYDRGGWARNGKENGKSSSCVRKKGLKTIKVAFYLLGQGPARACSYFIKDTVTAEGALGVQNGHHLPSSA